MNLRRLIVTLYFALFLGVAAMSGVFFWRAQQEYAQLRELENTTRKKLADAEQHLRDQEKVLDRLRTDPVFVEQVIRKRLGYAKPEEYIFRFEN